MESIVNKKIVKIRILLILVFISLLSMLLSFILLYRQTVQSTQTQLVEMCRSQARIYESIGKYNAFFSSRLIAGSARAATLSQIKESHRKYTGFGETGELVLAELKGDDVHFLLPTRKMNFRIPPPADLRDNIGIPMKLAFSRESGIVEALDHSGEKVIAAYEYLPFLEMGLVVKIDKSEILVPYLFNGIICLIAAGVLIVLGYVINLGTVKPLLDRIYEHTNQISRTKEQYQSLVSSIPGVVYHQEFKENFKTLFMSEPIEKISGFPASDFINNQVRTYESIIHPDDQEIIRRATGKYLKGGSTYLLEYRLINSNDETRWVNDQGSITSDESGKYLFTGVLLDITDRKIAEKNLSDLSIKLSKYLSPQVYKSIFKGDQDVKIGSTRKKLTVFFSDIVGFTKATEDLEPEDLSFIINTYLNKMSEITFKHGGTLDKFIGDGILVFFGDPESKGIKDDALACIEMAKEMNAVMEELKTSWQNSALDFPFQVRMGIATGYCTVGNFGSETRMDYTVLGRTVNLASRLESIAKPDSILVSQDAYTLIRDTYTCKPQEPVEVKGFDKPIKTFLVKGKL